MNIAFYSGSKEHEEKSFEKLLCAIYGRSYQLKNAAELVTLTDLARYYQALPIVSPTVYAAAIRNPEFYATILRNPCSVLEAAKTLRNDLLFGDSLILCLGPWSEPAYLELSDPELLKIASVAHSRICVKIAQAQPTLLDSLEIPIYSPKSDIAYYRDFCKKLSELTSSSKRHYKVMLPAYYRKCCERGLES